MSSAISGILNQITPNRLGADAPATATADSGFGSILKNAIDQVEQVNAEAQQQTTEVLRGDRSDLHNVMIAIEKADVSFQLMMQVRNKIVNAYEEISRMQF